MPTFRHHLRRIRLILCAARVLAAVLLVAALVAALLLASGLADAWAAFEPAARTWIAVVLTSICGISLLAGLFIALRVSARAAAEHADRALGDPRRSAAAAMSLDPGSAATPLAGFLTSRGLEAAAASLAALSWRKTVPWKLPGTALLALALPLLSVGALRLAMPAAFAVIAERMLHPGADIPPYSPLVFTIDPAKPSTVYGGEVLISAEITGAEITRPVECLIRKPGSHEILRLPAFRESATRFSRKPDGLTESIEIAFACGKARSAWHAVEILMEPNILGGIVRLTPPAHTNLPPAEFPLDSNEIAAIEGSSVTLELTSNRPLGSGNLVFTPAGRPGTESIPQSLPAALPNMRTASFTWTATEGGRIAATLRDLRGTPSPRPLELAFRIVPDMPPEVSLNSPPPWMLATPRSRIPVSGSALDDYGLSRVHFVRSLSGFRDRALLVAPALRGKEYDFSETLDLDSLGLDAGQTIELMLDASDHNPSLLGHGGSEISRIRIISEDEYAAHIRAKTTIDQFASRFRAAREAMEDARESLEELREAVEKADPEDIAKAAAKARDAHRQAAELLGKIAGDFQAFELEERLKELAEQQADELRGNIDPLENFDPKAPRKEQQEAIEDMLKRLERFKPQERELEADEELVKQAALLLEMAAKFREIYEAQASLAKRFGTIVEELRLGEEQNRRMLPSLADTQEKNRQALDDFKTELLRRIEALPAGDAHLAPLIGSARDFLLELDVANPETLMDAAAKHGRAGQAGDAFTQAEQARAVLERLMSEPGAFQQAAKGQAPQFDIPRPDVNRNLQEMLEAMLGRALGQGNGNQPGGAGQGPGGAGQGPGGVGMAGGRGNGFPMDLPVVGPERLEFSSASQSGGGGSGNKSRPVQPLPDTAEHGTLKPTDLRQGQSSAANPEAIPEPYRDAVKRFLTP